MTRKQMKRNEIIDLLNATGKIMDAFDHVEIKDSKTDEVSGTFGKDTLHGMQVAMHICIKLLDGTLECHHAIDLASRLINLYACAAMSFGQDECDGVVYRRVDADDSESAGEE